MGSAWPSLWMALASFVASLLPSVVLISSALFNSLYWDHRHPLQLPLRPPASQWQGWETGGTHESHPGSAANLP